MNEWMESSQRDLFIAFVVDTFIFKYDQITLSPFQWPKITKLRCHLYTQNRCDLQEGFVFTKDA